MSTDIVVVFDAHCVRHAGELKGKEMKVVDYLKKVDSLFPDIHFVDQLFGAVPI